MIASSSSPNLDCLIDCAGQPTAVPDTMESRLIRRAQEGDPVAFRCLVEAH